MSAWAMRSIIPSTTFDHEHTHCISWQGVHTATWFDGAPITFPHILTAVWAIILTGSSPQHIEIVKARVSSPNPNMICKIRVQLTHGLRLSGVPEVSRHQKWNWRNSTFRRSRYRAGQLRTISKGWYRMCITFGVNDSVNLWQFTHGKCYCKQLCLNTDLSRPDWL